MKRWDFRRHASRTHGKTAGPRDTTVVRCSAVSSFFRCFVRPTHWGKFGAALLGLLQKQEAGAMPARVLAPENLARPNPKCQGISNFRPISELRGRGGMLLWNWFKSNHQSRQPARNPGL